MLKSFHFESVDSTQDRAFSLLETGETGILVTADEQLKGRGRQAREWQSEKSKSLILSLGLSLQVRDLSGLSLVVGLAVREALQISEIQLKWPNDLMLSDSKVGGILIESRSQGSEMKLVIGVGLNLQDVGSFKGIHKEVSASDLGQKLGEKLGNKIDEFVQKFLKVGFFPFKNLYEEVLWKKGQQVQLLIQGETFQLELRGVSDEGALIAHDGRKLLLNSDGEILLDVQPTR